jgi:hypothetical protein
MNRQKLQTTPAGAWLAEQHNCRSLVNLSVRQSAARHIAFVHKCKTIVIPFHRTELNRVQIWIGTVVTVRQSN